jgi:hypothetical protein
MLVLACMVVYRVGNYVESKQLLIHTLKLWREQGNDFWVAEHCGVWLSQTRMLGLTKEGIQQLEEALKIYKQLQ